MVKSVKIRTQMNRGFGGFREDFKKIRENPPNPRLSASHFFLTFLILEVLSQIRGHFSTPDSHY